MIKKEWFVIIKKDLDNMGPRYWEIMVVYCYEPRQSSSWKKASGPYQSEKEAEESFDRALDIHLAQEV